MFVAVGIIGVAVLLFGLLVDDVFDGLLPGGDWLSLTSIATFLSAFGLLGWILTARFDTPTPVAVLGGTAAGIALGAVAVRWSRSLATMATDATPTAADLVGCGGRLVTAIPAGSTGEALIRIGGQPVKLTAVAATAIDRGTEVVVVDVLSSTKVSVEPADQFWGPADSDAG